MLGYFPADFPVRRSEQFMLSENCQVSRVSQCLVDYNWRVRIASVPQSLQPDWCRCDVWLKMLQLAPDAILQFVLFRSIWSRIRVLMFRETICIRQQTLSPVPRSTKRLCPKSNYIRAYFRAKWKLMFMCINISNFSTAKNLLSFLFVVFSGEMPPGGELKTRYPCHWSGQRCARKF